MTKPWFEKAFTEDYLKLYAHRDETEATQAARLITTATALPPNSLILDAPCGAGRHIKAFTAHDHKTYGFDLSMPLLRAATQSGVPPRQLTRADLRAIPYRPHTFDMVVNLFSSLGYFNDDNTNLAVLAELVTLTKPQGWIVIDFMNALYLQKNLVPNSQRTTPNGTHIADRRWIDGTPPRVNKQTTVTFPDQTTKTFDESVRLFTPDELRQALQNCGIHIRHEYGDYTGTPFTPQSTRIILIGQRP